MQRLPPGDGSGGVVVQVDFVRHRHDLAVRVVPAGRADVVWALELAAVRAFVWVERRERIVGAAIVAARFRNLVLLDSHVAISIPGGLAGPVSIGCRRLFIPMTATVQPPIPAGPGKCRDSIAQNRPPAGRQPSSPPVPPRASRSRRPDSASKGPGGSPSSGAASS